VSYIPEVLTFGESMGLFYPNEGISLENAALLAQSFGGAESNFAVGLARLGHKVGWFGHLGNDPVGTRILKTLRGEGVDTSRVKLRTDASTGLMLRQSLRGQLSVYYYRSGSAASRMAPADLDESYVAGTRILHITGITPALSDSCRETVRHAVTLAKRHGVKISFDPNIRLKLWSAEEARPVLLELAEAADYFFPGYDELVLLYGTDDETAIRERVLARGGITVVKSANGFNWVAENGAIHELPFEKAERMVDPVGAGDGFCSGFLAGILDGLSSLEAARLGGIVGSLVVQAPGDWEALPGRPEVDRLLQHKKHIER
jgi:2-dehydro-3-deoxygluconokinase